MQAKSTSRKNEPMRKIQIAAVGIMVALVATITGGTIAYFTDQTDTINNVFTVGNVEVSIDQGAFDRTTGTTNTNKRVMKINYGKIASGEHIEADPTIHVSPNSADCYVILVIDTSKWNTINLYNQRINNVYPRTGEAFVKSITEVLYDDFNSDDFAVANEDEIEDAVRSSNKPTYLRCVLITKEPVGASDQLKLFGGIGVPDGINSRILGSVSTMNTGSYKTYVTAIAIQADNLIQEETGDPGWLIAYMVARDVLGSDLGVEPRG